jgi:hypothetical protein
VKNFFKEARLNIRAQRTPNPSRPQSPAPDENEPRPSVSPGPAYEAQASSSASQPPFAKATLDDGSRNAADSATYVSLLLHLEPFKTNLVYRCQWEQAYRLAKKKLSEEEQEQLNHVDLSGSSVDSLIAAVKDAGQQMKQRHPASMGKMENILKSLDKYAKIVDVGIQHSPEITYVCQSLGKRKHGIRKKGRFLNQRN